MLIILSIYVENKHACLAALADVISSDRRPMQLSVVIKRCA